MVLAICGLHCPLANSDQIVQVGSPLGQQEYRGRRASGTKLKQGGSVRGSAAKIKLSSALAKIPIYEDAPAIGAPGDFWQLASG